MLAENAIPTEPCPDCGGAAHKALKPHSFTYEGAELTATIPLWTCEECGFSYIDQEGAALEHDTVCRHLGLLTPHEIRDLRKRHDLTQAEFAELTGFGLRTIKRWERGALLQNVSADRFLRLIDDAEVFGKISHY